jgi:hypothetical protein
MNASRALFVFVLQRLTTFLVAGFLEELCEIYRDPQKKFKSLKTRSENYECIG